MKFLERLFAAIEVLLGKPEPLKLPILTISGKIEGNELYTLLSSRFIQTSIYLPDLTFNLASVDEYRKIIEWSRTKYQKYIVDDFDCDDFAWMLMGAVSIYPWSSLPFGTIWTNKHAMNIFIDDKKHIWFVEPQTWTIKDALESWQGEQVQLLVM